MDPVRIVQAWEATSVQVARTVGPVEPQVIVIPSQDDSDMERWTVCAFVDTEEVDGFRATCHHILGHETEPAEWVAHCGPVFELLVPIDGPLPEPGGDLQRRAEAGDDQVREVLAVTVVTRTGLYGQTFVPPLNEPDGDVSLDIYPGGRIAATLAALLFALNGGRR